MTPRKRVLALALLAGVVAISSALAASDGKAPAGTTFKLLEDEARGTFVPIGHHTGLAPGDEGFTNRTLRTLQKKPVGQLHFSCVTTKGDPNWIQICTGVYELAGGTLVGTTLDSPSQGPNTLHIAITGGTGRYEGARGSILSVGSSTGLATDTIHLLP